MFYFLRSIEVYVPPDLTQVGIIITHKKSITTLVWNHGYQELTTTGTAGTVHYDVRARSARHEREVRDMNTKCETGTCSAKHGCEVQISHKIILLCCRLLTTVFQ